MKLLQRRSRSLLHLVLLASVALASPPGRAQEEAGEDEGGHAMFYRAEAWIAQPVGLDYSPATRSDPLDPFGNEVVRYNYDTKAELRQVVGYNLPKDIGQLSLTYYTHDDQRTLSDASPGSFVFGESLANPLFAGYDDFGRADRFDSATSTRLRDWHLDFSRPAFRTPHVSGTWSIGWRRVSHDRQMSSIYRALVPNQPPIGTLCAPNCPDMSPLVDTARIASSFEGRGVNLGLDLDFHLWKDKLTLEGGVALSLLRGNMDSAYTSLVSRYFDTFHNAVVGPPFSEFTQCRNPPFPEGGCTLQNPPLIFSIDQQTIATGLFSEGLSTTSNAIDAHIGFRWIVTSYLDLTLGFRQTSYEDVGVDRRGFGTEMTQVPLGAGLSTDFTVRVQETSEQSRSAIYEGFYLGATFSFF